MSRFEDLWEGYLMDKLTEAELQELMQLLQNGDEKVRTAIISLLEEGGVAGPGQKEKADFIFSRLMRRAKQPASVVKMRTWPGIAVAAAVLFLISITVAWLLNQNVATRSVAKASQQTGSDVPPGADRATLTLADGSLVYLDSAAKGALARQGGVTVLNLNGKLAYETKEKATEVLYNTVSTPRGGQYQLELADGTKVWLNAASSLRFPTTFNGNDRQVELTGEGYFEVAHDASKPFHVRVNDMDVQVLGTHFNINSYGDEQEIKTTLLAGSVLVTNNTEQAFLHPGQQAVVKQGQDNVRVDNKVDIEDVMAWKNGLFAFNNTSLDEIMKQIGRWYNVDVVYESDVPQETFNGTISRNTNLSDVLKVLEYSNVRFRVEGNIITVLGH